MYAGIYIAADGVQKLTPDVRIPTTVPQYLCNGLEEDILLRRSALAAAGGIMPSEKELLERSCGKV